MRPPDATKPTPGGDVGFGKADNTGNGEAKYTSSGPASQWAARTSPDLIALVLALRWLFPTTPLPTHVQRALGHQWSGA